MYVFLYYQLACFIAIIPIESFFLFIYLVGQKMEGYICLFVGLAWIVLIYIYNMYMPVYYKIKIKKDTFTDQEKNELIFSLLPNINWIF